MNNYKSAMDKLTLTDEARQKILANAASVAQTKPKPRKKSASRILSVAACIALLAGALYAGSTWLAPSQQGTGIQLVNPIEEQADIAALRATADFDIYAPTALPKGFKLKHASLIGGKIADIVFENGSDTIRYRTALGSDDISGDYGKYEWTGEAQAEDTDISLRGTDSLAAVATWQKDGLSFALSFSPAAEPQVVTAIVESLEK